MTREFECGSCGAVFLEGDDPLHTRGCDYFINNDFDPERDDAYEDPALDVDDDVDDDNEDYDDEPYNDFDGSNTGNEAA